MAKIQCLSGFHWSRSFGRELGSFSEFNGSPSRIHLANTVNAKEIPAIEGNRTQKGGNFFGSFLISDLPF